MLFLQSIAEFPWWVTLIGMVTGIGLGITGALPWRSAAQAARAAEEAANSERDTLRATRDRLLDENRDLTAQVAVLKAKTDLNGLREQMTKTITELKDEFKHHSDQDLENARQQVAATQQQTAALQAVKETLRVVQEQIKK